MSTCRNVWLVACLSVLVVPVCEVQSTRTATDVTAGSGSVMLPAARRTSWRRRLRSGRYFENHQFAGRNSFHVEYEAGVLKGAEFYPKGHAVPATTYPYFQSVLETITDYIAKYPDQDDFYEVFGMISRRVMREFSQIQKITLLIDTPAYGPVNVDRGETITQERKSPRK